MLNDKLLPLFINTFTQELNKNKIPTFQEICYQLLSQLNLAAENYHQHFTKNNPLLAWYEDVTQFKYLNDFFTIEQLNEIIFHGPQTVQLDINGTLSTPDQIEPVRDWQLKLEVLALLHGAVWNSARPYQSFTSNHQGIAARFTLAHYSLSSQCPSKLFIRLLPTHKHQLSDFTQNIQILEWLPLQIQAKKNILITGATSSGKTTFLNALLSAIGPQEHVIVLEDTRELTASTRGEFTFLLAQDRPEHSLKDMVTYSLRMRPDRLIVGEIRSAEIVPLTLALNTGHNGLLASAHASSASSSIQRLGLLLLYFAPESRIDLSLAMQMIASNFDLVIFLQARQIREIIRPLGVENGNLIFERIF